jgi:hypothetical protein
MKLVGKLKVNAKAVDVVEQELLLLVLPVHLVPQVHPSLHLRLPLVLKFNFFIKNQK